MGYKANLFYNHIYNPKHSLCNFSRWNGWNGPNGPHSLYSNPLDFRLDFHQAKPMFDALYTALGLGTFMGKHLIIYLLPVLF